MIRLLVFFSFIKVISLQNAHMSFSIDGYGLDVGGWVWVRTGISYQCYVVSLYDFCRHVCIHCLYQCRRKSWWTGYLPGCAGAYATHELFALVCMCAILHGMATTLQMWFPVLIHRYIVHTLMAILHGMATTLQMWFPVLIHMFICTYMHYMHHQ